MVGKRSEAPCDTQICVRSPPCALPNGLMLGAEQMPLGKRSRLLGEGHSPWEAAAAEWVAQAAVCLIPGVSSHRTGSVPGRLRLETLAGGKVGIHQKGPFAKGRGSQPLARAWLRSELLLLGWHEGPKEGGRPGLRGPLSPHLQVGESRHSTEVLGSLHQGTRLSHQPWNLNLAASLRVPHSEAAVRWVLTVSGPRFSHLFNGVTDTAEAQNRCSMAL